MKLSTIVLLFCITNFVNTLTYIEDSNGSSNNTYLNNIHVKNKRSVVLTNGKRSFVTKIALFCDLECGEYFQNDRTKIVNYLLTLVLDLNMIYSSIRTYDLSFVVTSFTQINSTREQSFIDNFRKADGSVDLNSILRPFGEWLYIKKRNLPEFHLALLVTGTSGHSVMRTHSYSDSLCLDLEEYNVFWGAIIFRLAIPNGVFCSQLVKSLAYSMYHIVNVTGDTNHVDCWDKEYVFETKTLHCTSPHRFFFSKCSEKSIVTFLSSDKASCLVSNPNLNYAASTYVLNYDTIITPSMTEQCKIQTNRSDAIVKEENCLEARCYDGSGTNATFFQRIFPFVNTPCGNSSFCFRGRCIVKGYRIQNSNNSDCLQGSNRFSYNDKVILSRCAEFPTPFDRLMLLEKQNSRLYLATPYSTPDSEENSDKCVSIDHKTEQIVFDRCSESHPWFEWSLIKERTNDQDFILHHHYTNKCLNVDQTGRLSLATKCHFNLSSIKWRIIESPPTSIFTEMTTTKQPSITEKLSTLQNIVKHTRLNVISTTPTDEIRPLETSSSGISKSDFNMHGNEISRGNKSSFNNIWLGMFIGVISTCGVLTAMYLVKFTRFWRKRNAYPTVRVAYRAE